MDPEEKDQQLSQEVARRLFRFARKRPMKEKIKVLDEITLKLKRSGYSVKQSRKIIISGIRNYKSKAEERKTSGELKMK